MKWFRRSHSTDDDPLLISLSPLRQQHYSYPSTGTEPASSGDVNEVDDGNSDDDNDQLIVQLKTKALVAARDAMLIHKKVAPIPPPPPPMVNETLIFPMNGKTHTRMKLDIINRAQVAR